MLQLIENPPTWPNGARCAVCFAYDMDAESLLHLYYPEDSMRRITLSSALRYGPRIAMPRIMRIWKHFDIRQTVYVPGWCVETYPDVVRMLADEGHEIGHHGWLHERVNALTPEGEADVLRRGIDAITALTGQRPVGYRCPSGAFSPQTLDLLIAEGFRYDASLAGDDVPYMIESSGGRMIELPSDHALDDWPQYVNMRDFNHMLPIQPPDVAMRVFRSEFDAAWEGGGIWSSVWHPFVSGRPARAAATVELIEYMQDRGGVWFATMAEIAAHIDGLVSRGEWVPRSERLPFWSEPVPQIARPIR
ncbi:MAG: polysaccharide deacetylase [Rhodobacteraceae bacterium]|nr:polysaccharide deacetylase [Paracoccaceae bacterium]